MTLEVWNCELYHGSHPVHCTVQVYTDLERAGRDCAEEFWRQWSPPVKVLIDLWNFFGFLAVSCSKVANVCIRVLLTPWSGLRLHNSILNVCIYASLRWTEGGEDMNILLKYFIKASMLEQDNHRLSLKI
jgi:hypothetical protein